MKKLPESERLRLIIQAALCLTSARNLLARAGAEKACGKVRAALSSTNGAIRNRGRFAAKEIAQ